MQNLENVTADAVSYDMPITSLSIKRATDILAKYKSGKAALESRVIEDEKWWKLNQWDVFAGDDKTRKLQTVKSTSAWLFNTIVNKHADSMDNFPNPVALPREPSDKQTADTLSNVLPVIMEQNDFEAVYSDNEFEKIKHGTSVYGVFYDSGKQNGLGDLSITAIDLLNIFWEPGIQDIQDSRNLFVVKLVDNDILEQTYPELKGKLTGNAIDVSQYAYDDTVDTSDKSCVVDWYYKVQYGQKTLLHFVKFVGDTVLFASENDPAYAQTGWYEHGMYPVVFDTIFPEKGTPCGFGYVTVCRNPQMYIDKLSSNLLESAIVGSKTRYFGAKSLNINKDQFLNVSEPIVEVSGEVTDTNLRQIQTAPPAPIYFNILSQKIEEMKETSSNRDVSSGGSGSVTAAAAIAALQEAGNKVSRDIIKSSYRSYRKIVYLCIELIRQFYDTNRFFRITEPNGSYKFASINNRDMRDVPIMDDMGRPMSMADGTAMTRKPVFDIKIKAVKQNPFSQMQQNETAKELYAAGMFSPERAQEASLALSMMDFEGIDQVRQAVSQGGTLLEICKEQAARIDALTQMLAAVSGAGPVAPQNVPQGAKTAGGGNNTQMSANVAQGDTQGAMGGNDTIAGAVMDANRVNMTSYGQRLAQRSRPSLEEP